MAHIVQLIYCEQATGDGTAENPFRPLPQLWTLDGQLIAQVDGATADRKVFLNLAVQSLHQGKPL